MPTPRSLALAGALVSTGLCLTACGGEPEVLHTEHGQSSSDHSPDADAPVTIQITEEDDSVRPSGDTVGVEQGQDIQLVVTSDVADEIHVHSTPEHEFEVPADAEGEKLEPFSIDTPGTVEVESHGLEVVIVKLQVS